LLSPILPSKVVCVGRNYAEHVAEHGSEVPKEPLLFLKPSTSVIGPHDVIRLPPQSKQVEHEAELAVVIGAAGARRVDRASAQAAIFGYTCANDVTARDLQRLDGQWTRAKGFDSFCPIGPWITTGVDVSDVEVRCEVNEEVRQLGRTKDMVFDVPTRPGTAAVPGVHRVEEAPKVADIHEPSGDGWRRLADQVAGGVLPAERARGHVEREEVAVAAADVHDAVHDGGGGVDDVPRVVGPERLQGGRGLAGRDARQVRRAAELGPRVGGRGHGRRRPLRGHGRRQEQGDEQGRGDAHGYFGAAMAKS
jgi:hypothetical protein